MAPIPKSGYMTDVWKDGIFELQQIFMALTTVDQPFGRHVTLHFGLKKYIYVLSRTADCSAATNYTDSASIENRTVFVTGGAGSIPSAQVRALVTLGANACIIGRNEAKTQTAAADIATVRPGSKVLGIGGVDVRSAESLQKAVERCRREIGPVDYCIAAAAGNFLAPMDKLSPNAFKSVIDIDVLGSYNTLKAVLPDLIRSAKANVNDGKSSNTATGGRIIFVSATLHYTGSTPLQTHVSAAKSAVDSLSAATAIEQGPRGVTSNVIAPGPIGGTEGMERLASSSASSKRAQGSTVPLGRFGAVREIADATVYLFSAAGNYVNGEVLVVDGGSWRLSSGSGVGGGFVYPDFLLSGEEVKGVKSGRKERLGSRL